MGKLGAGRVALAICIAVFLCCAEFALSGADITTEISGWIYDVTTGEIISGGVLGAAVSPAPCSGPPDPFPPFPGVQTPSSTGYDIGIVTNFTACVWFKYTPPEGYRLSLTCSPQSGVLDLGPIHGDPYSIGEGVGDPGTNQLAPYGCEQNPYYLGFIVYPGQDLHVNQNNISVEPKEDTTTLLESSTNPSAFGQAVTFTATVTVPPPGGVPPTGNVLFLEGTAVLGTASLDGSGKASLSTSLPGGTHQIVAEYSGDPNFNGSTSNGVAQEVNPADTVTQLASSPNPSVSGQAVTFTATVTVVLPGSGTPTGEVAFVDGATVLGTAGLDGSGKAGLSTSSLAAGTHQIVAEYAGDPDFNSSTSTTLPQTVSRGDVSGDGVIDLVDVRLCLQIATGYLNPTEAQRAAADVDWDNDVDMDDVTILSEYILGIHSTLP